jgi:hypothetical protein
MHALALPHSVAIPRGNTGGRTAIPYDLCMRLSRTPARRGFYIKLMSPLGWYPSKNVILKRVALIVSPKLCFTILRISKRDWSFSEVDLLRAKDIPFLGSILLANVGYPYPMQGVSVSEDDAEISEQCISKCRAILLRQLRLTYRSEFRRSPALHRPPALGGPPYRLDEGQEATKVVRDWLRLVSRQDAVFLRGLASLIKAHMAWEHPEFGDAACIYQWIALDAAHSLTLGRLKARGNKNPSSQDAGKYFEEVTGEKTIWTKFFETDYENRIRALHPDNRFGAEAHPQFLADDFYELRDVLMPYYRYLLTGIYESSLASRETGQP